MPVVIPRHRLSAQAAGTEDWTEYFIYPVHWSSSQFRKVFVIEENASVGRSLIYRVFGSTVYASLAYPLHRGLDGQTFSSATLFVLCAIAIALSFFVTL